LLNHNVALRFALILVSVWSLALGVTRCHAQQAKKPFTVPDEIGLALFDWPAEVLFSPDENYFVVKTERGRLDINRVEDAIADEVSAIVQAAVPCDDCSRRRNMRLLLAMRFFRGVEGAIEDLYAAVGIRFVAIGAVGSESGADFLDVVRGRRLAFEIPSSKLDAHDLLPCFSFDLDMSLATVFVSLIWASLRSKPAISG